MLPIYASLGRGAKFLYVPFLRVFEQTIKHILPCVITFFFYTVRKKETLLMLIQGLQIFSRTPCLFSAGKSVYK